MGKISTTIAVISDLHCHAKLSGSQESFLIAGERRLPAQRHPTEALRSLIKAQKLTADLVICPGDLAHRVCEAGMSHAFSDLQLLERELKANALLCCLGNHDVASRGGKDGSDPFRLARELATEFPVSDSESKEKFESSGYCLCRQPSGVDILLLNSVIDHKDEESALCGTFDDTRLNSLDEYLATTKSIPEALRIAVMHHHPILHSFANYESSDVLSNGDAILDVLVKHGFRLVIHGHRHEPRLKNHPTKYGQLTVFAAGSFAAILNKLGSVTRNMFHLVNIQGDDEFVSGAIQTWEFNYGMGWNPTSFKSGGFCPRQEFKSNARSISASDVVNAFSSLGNPVVSRGALIEALPDINYLMPTELRQLSFKLQQNHRLKITFDENGDLSTLGEIVGSN